MIELNDIRLGDTVLLRNGEQLVVDSKIVSYTDREGEHEGPFISTRAMGDRYTLSDIVEIVERNPRRCRYCGEGITAKGEEIDYCKLCFYSGQSQEEKFGPLIKRLNTVSNGREWSVWHTGGGCFCLGTWLTPETSPGKEDGLEFMASDDSVLPEDPNGPWLIGAFEWESGEMSHDAGPLDANGLVAHVAKVVAEIDAQVAAS